MKMSPSYTEGDKSEWAMKSKKLEDFTYKELE